MLSGQGKQAYFLALKEGCILFQVYPTRTFFSQVGDIGEDAGATFNVNTFQNTPKTHSNKEIMAGGVLGWVLWHTGILCAGRRVPVGLQADSVYRGV